MLPGGGRDCQGEREAARTVTRRCCQEEGGTVRGRKELSGGRRNCQGEGVSARRIRCCYGRRKEPSQGEGKAEGEWVVGVGGLTRKGRVIGRLRH
jgi:hypothetical protein